MTKPAAAFAGMIGLLLGPLALAGPTAWLLAPVHAVFALVVCLGAAWDGLAGHVGRTRAWGFGYLLATLGMVACLELGAGVSGGSMGYWGPPWLLVATWAWIPPVIAGLAGMLAGQRSGALSRKAVRRRRKEAAG